MAREEIEAKNARIQEQANNLVDNTTRAVAIAQHKMSVKLLKEL